MMDKASMPGSGTTYSTNMAAPNMFNLRNFKDSRWLQVEICREFQRNTCRRPDTDCRFAHAPPNVEVQNGKVMACFDSIKGRCQREQPPCKYFHPPPHLKDQLLANGRTHLALKNAIMLQMRMALGQAVAHNQIPASIAINPHLPGGAINPYFVAAGAFVPPATGLPLITRGNEMYPGPGANKRPFGETNCVLGHQPISIPPPGYQQLMQLQQPFPPVPSANLSDGSNSVTTSVGTSGGSGPGSDIDSHEWPRFKMEPTGGSHYRDGNNIEVSSNNGDDDSMVESSTKRMRRNSNTLKPMPQNNNDSTAYTTAAQNYQSQIPATLLQQQQQQQLLHQYQALAAAALANPAAFQNPAFTMQRIAETRNNLNAAASGWNSFAVVSPYLAQQLAAAQILATAPPCHAATATKFNHSAAFANLQGASSNLAATAAPAPYGVQFRDAPNTQNQPTFPVSYFNGQLAAGGDQVPAAGFARLKSPPQLINPAATTACGNVGFPGRGVKRNRPA